MNSKAGEPAERIKEVLKAINGSWLEGRPQEGGEYLHDDVVMVLPGFSGRVQGREAMIESWEEFLSNAMIEDFSESEYEVDVVGTTALASYTFRIRYAMADKSYRGSGRDVWGFALESGRWVAAWRFLTDMDEQEI